MAIKSSIRQNKQINRAVYGLLTVVITTFVSILILIQLQHNEEIKREALDIDYHMAISKHSLKIMRLIDTTRIWFRDQEIIHLNSKISLNEESGTSSVQIELQGRSQINKLKAGIEKPIKEIIRLQEKYNDPEFKITTLLLGQVHERLRIGLVKLLATKEYSSQMIDTTIEPLTESISQLQQLHQHTYQEMVLSFENFQREKRVQIISLIIALALVGLASVFTMLRYVRATLGKLTNTQADLQHERDFSNSLVMTAPVIILLLDKEGKIQHVNPYFEQLTGYGLNEIKGTEWMTTFLPMREQKPIHELLKRILQGISVRGKVSPIVTRDGKERDIEWYTETMYDISGTITGVLSIGMDITKRRQAETEINKYRVRLEELVLERTAGMKAARDEAERSNAAKSLFLSHMSHELRTPMNAILGFAQLLKLDAGDLNESQNENIMEILDAGYHLLQLINELLDLGRIEAGKLKISMKDIKVDDVLQQSITLIYPQAEKRQLNIIDNISGHKHYVHADFTRLKQAMVNLLSNAVKYNQNQGRIILEAKIIDKKRLRIYVIDTGRGLNKDEITRLFTSFERLDTTDNVEGTGIGLVITRNLIELMGGTINVESTPGQGSKFWLELELAKNKEV